MAHFAPSSQVTWRFDADCGRLIAWTEQQDGEGDEMKRLFLISWTGLDHQQLHLAAMKRVFSFHFLHHFARQTERFELFGELLFHAAARVTIEELGLKEAGHFGAQ